MVDKPTNNLTDFISGAFSTGAGIASVIVLGLIGIMIVTRVLPVEEYGAFEVVLVIVASLQAASGIGIDISVERFLAGTKDQEERSRILNSAIAFRIMSVLVIGFLFLLAQEPIFLLFGSSVFTELVIYVPILIILESGRSLFGAALIGTFRFSQVGISNFISSVLNFVSILVFVLWFRWGLTGLIMAKIVSRFVALLYAMIVVNIKYRVVFDIKLLREMIVFSFPLYINYFLTQVFGRIDRILIGIFLGTTEVGFYAIARRIPDSLEELYGAFRQVYFPYAVRFSALGEKLKMARLLEDSNRATSFVALFGALFTLAFGNEIVSLIFSSNYLPSIGPFIVLMMALVFVVIDSNLGFTLVALGQTNKPPIINAIGSIVVFGSYLWLIPEFGILGASIAVLLGLLVTNPINIYFLRKEGVQARFVPFVKPTLLFVLFSVFLFFMPELWGRLFVVALFPILSFTLRVVTIDDVKELWMAIQPLFQKIFDKGRIEDVQHAQGQAE